MGLYSLSVLSIHKQIYKNLLEIGVYYFLVILKIYNHSAKLRKQILDAKHVLADLI